ncbi:hypothetical protein BSNK01_14540 [Bacillaceae bacterium]
MGKRKKKASAAAGKKVFARPMQCVTSDVCAVCQSPCERGMNYLAKMSQPGRTGFGVPCILTKGQHAAGERK